MKKFPPLCAFPSITQSRTDLLLLPPNLQFCYLCLSANNHLSAQTYQTHPTGPGHSELFPTIWSRWPKRKDDCWPLIWSIQSQMSVWNLFFNHYFIQTLPTGILTFVRSLKVCSFWKNYWEAIRDFASEPWRIPFTEAKERLKSNSDTTASALVSQILSNVKQK